MRAAMLFGRRTRRSGWAYSQPSCRPPSTTTSSTAGSPDVQFDRAAATVKDTVSWFELDTHAPPVLARGEAIANVFVFVQHAHTTLHLRQAADQPRQRSS